MKKNLTLLLLLILTPLMSWAQESRRPIFMVLPSDEWCIQNGFATEHEISGEKFSIPDYYKALDNSQELKDVLNIVSAEVSQATGLLPSSLETTLRSIAETSETSGTSQNKDFSVQLFTEPSLFDKLTEKSRAEILLYVSWQVDQLSMRQPVIFKMVAFDVYSSKQIAAISCSHNSPAGGDISRRIGQVLMNNMHILEDGLRSHIESIFANGREVSLNCLMSRDANLTFDSEIDGKSIASVIEDWVESNSKDGCFNLALDSDRRLKFDQIRVPLVREDGRSLDIRYWGRGLMIELTKCNLNVSSGIKGIANPYIIINGSK